MKRQSDFAYSMTWSDLCLFRLFFHVEIDSYKMSLIRDRFFGSPFTPVIIDSDTKDKQVNLNSLVIMDDNLASNSILGD
jgi:hypothetical protein